MDNWDPSVVYQMATQRHHENIARGETAQRRAALLGAPSARARLAVALVALAAWLDATAPLARPDTTARPAPTTA